jgi:hypothetical protein
MLGTWWDKERGFRGSRVQRKRGFRVRSWLFFGGQEEGWRRGRQRKASEKEDYRSGY